MFQRGRGYLAARDGDCLERDHPRADIPLLECSARDNTGIHQIFTTLLQLSGTSTTPVFFLITHLSSSPHSSIPPQVYPECCPPCPWPPRS